MTDYFKTIRAYLRGKWGRKSIDFSVNEWDAYFTRERAIHSLMLEIDRLRRNKKKHSHLQKQLDDLLNGGAQISDQKTETTK